MYRSGTGIELKVSVSKMFERYPALSNTDCHIQTIIGIQSYTHKSSYI